MSDKPITPPDSLDPAGDNMFQRMSKDFVDAQQTVGRTVQELRVKVRDMHDRLGHCLVELEHKGPEARLDPLIGLHEQGAAVERTARILAAQLESLERGCDAVRGVSRKVRL